MAELLRNEGKSMDNNYIALLIAIFRKATPEQAFLLVSKPNAYRRNLAKVYTDKDVEDMIKLNSIYTYKQIGKIYNLSPTTIEEKIAREKLKKTPYKVPSN